MDREAETERSRALEVYGSGLKLAAGAPEQSDDLRMLNRSDAYVV